MAGCKVPVSPGFTLIEVMVTLVVLAVGLLGLSALLSTGLRFNTSAVYRSQATNMAYFIIDCMQANRTAAIAQDYVSGIPDTLPACSAPTVSALAGSTLAEQDLDLWRQTLACVLPQGTGAIAVNTAANSPPNSFTVTVQWDDSHGQQSPQQFTTATGL